ncbi:hypothetical protein LRAMOSA00108 [Lichtheimia ramosa]|uniref:Oxidase FUB9 n=1 Tax=Lichtheimia ramosa TaxID=688394 RepID=A0A077W9E0_9FUNG|nr:hypothetical protein LRAMOSA00108 [Lichtheimia ramosa]
MTFIPASLDDFEELARKSMAPGSFAYYSTGSSSESTLRRNREAYDKLLIRPKILVDVEQVDTSTTILGQPISMPICVAPTAYHGLAHYDGELASARGTARMNTLYTLSSNSGYGIGQVADAARKVNKNALQWFQLYMEKDRDLTEKLVRKCEEAGYKALVVTTDRPRLGPRLRTVRNGFRLPQYVKRANYESDNDGAEDYMSGEMYPGMTWEDIKWIKSITKLPIVIKGIFRGEDAKLAVQYGVDAIVVSNHGGRQLDSSPATLEVLPEIVQACRGSNVEVYFDGGIRTGTDVFKALAIGAKAVFIGRPVLYGLAYQGESGVRQVLSMISHDFRLTMGLAGCTKVSAIDKSFLMTESQLDFTKALAKL